MGFGFGIGMGDDEDEKFLGVLFGFVNQAKFAKLCTILSRCIDMAWEGFGVNLFLTCSMNLSRVFMRGSEVLGFGFWMGDDDVNLVCMRDFAEFFLVV